MKTAFILTLTLSAVIGGVVPCHAAPTVTISQETKTALPEVWQKVPTAQRLQYVRAAEVDATRILAERIMGLSLDGETDVRDLAAANDAIKGQLKAALKGVKTEGTPTYHDDGRIEVVRSVKVSNLIKCITTSTNPKNNGTSYKTVTEELHALGNAAIPGSVGSKRVRAKRAAEMDVYRRLAERIAGIALTSDTTVKDFAVESDAVKSSFSHILKSAEITAITYEDDVARVTANVKIEPLVRTIVREKAANGKVLNVTESTRQQSVEETGVGVLESVGENAGGDAPASAPTSKEIDNIVEEIL